MTPTFASFAIVFSLLAGDGLAGEISTGFAAPSRVGSVAAIDVPAPARFSGTPDAPRSGGQAARLELDDAARNDALSAWYWLTYIDGGSRLRVFEHYAAATADPTSELFQSANLAWLFANKAVGSDDGAVTSDGLPAWARFRTGDDGGPSAGLLLTLAYIDALTPETLVGDLRVAGTGAIGPDGVVMPVAMVDVKVAAALLTRPDVIFTPEAPTGTENVTIVKSEHTRLPDADSTVAEWLNVTGYELAGRDAASHPGTVPIVVVHDVRQALAWLCGRTDTAATCAIARSAASIPIGAA